MAHDKLKQEVCRANKALVEAGLVVLTWGNVSGVDRASGVMAIKPSGVGYDDLIPKDIPLLSIKTGEIIEAGLQPSTDTPTHLLLYQEFESIGGVVHIHSTYATAWAQAEREIPCLGTTHADHFSGSVPLTRPLRPAEIQDDYECNTGRVIVERFAELGLNAADTPAVLVRHHGPFIWGENPQSAIENAIALEEVARMTAVTMQINSQALPCPEALLEKHFLRKHGSNAYYGQRSGGASSS
ncbi:MAG: L-ribulose-5-phosphate 4-epimerase AraD [Planctomycetota bacterium]|nr:MAG: L-ribulose-5-phosphate 4-epimerase AraD [Planctomycetota bacterium]